MKINLNPEQTEAVKHIKGPLLVFAGAGTGKTRVITHRIANMIASGISPDSILAVTFTNKAANEMKERIGKLLNSNKSKDIFVSTFHSLGAFILKKHINHLGFRKKFSIYDTSECLSVLRKIIRDEISWKPAATPADLLSIIARYRLVNYSGRKDAYFGMNHSQLKELANFYTEYLKNYNAVDFDDLIFLPLQLLKISEIAEYYQNKFKYIMIDEFQDTNAPQFEIVKKISEVHKNLCVVGDDDQSIYSFRGSDFSHILNFQKIYTEAKIITLDQNYRSTKLILEAANAVVKNNTLRKVKKLWTGIEKSEPIILIKAVDEKEEAKMVISSIFQMHSSGDFKWGDVSILYRTNTQSRSFEEEILSKKIPYKIIGGIKFYERKEVKDIIAYLKIVHNPFDEAALYRIINIPSRGIGQTTISKINEYCLKNNCNFYKGLQDIEQITDISKSTKETIQSFIELLILFSELVKKVKLSVFIRTLIEKINYKSEIEKQYSNLDEVYDKYNNCLGIVHSAADYENSYGDDSSLEDFLTRISLMNDSDSMKDDKNDTSVLRLMTLHNSKGLEFPCVAIVGLNEGYLPHEKSGEINANIEEERRLFYVGITRARQKLIFSYSFSKNSYGKEVKMLPSRFLKEVPKESMDDLSKPISGNDLKDFFASLHEKLK